ncbi:MAG: hypothetical protein BIFFINMI_03910 [Phycisphaerae bacterium]|nr:hypothetical protein [Phycisphaerae bacterium]
MGENRDSHIKRLDRLCDAFRRQLRLRHLLTGVARVVVVALVVAVVIMTLDWMQHLDWPVRLVLLLFYVAAMGSAVWFSVLRPLGRRWNNTEVLSYMDAVTPQGQAMLLDLYELVGRQDEIQEAQTETGRQLVGEALDRLEPLADQVRPSQGLSGRVMLRWLAATLGVVVVLAGASWTMPNYARAGLVRFINPFSRYAWPHDTDIAVYRPVITKDGVQEVPMPEGGWSVAAFKKMPLEIQVSGTVPPSVELQYRSIDGRWSAPVKLLVERRPDRPAGTGVATYEFDQVKESLEFRVSGGDYETPIMTVLVTPQPYVTKVLVDYDYPSYVGRPDRKGVDRGEIDGPQGTNVHMVFLTSMPLTKAIFDLDEELSDQHPLSVADREVVRILAKLRETQVDLGQLVGELPTGKDKSPISDAQSARMSDLRDRQLLLIGDLRSALALLAAGAQEYAQRDADNSTVMRKAGELAGVPGYRLAPDVARAADALKAAQLGDAATALKSLADKVRPLSGQLAAAPRGSDKTTSQNVGDAADALKGLVAQADALSAAAGTLAQALSKPDAKPTPEQVQQRESLRQAGADLVVQADLVAANVTHAAVALDRSKAEAAGAAVEAAEALGWAGKPITDRLQASCDALAARHAGDAAGDLRKASDALEAVRDILQKREEMARNSDTEFYKDMTLRRGGHYSVELYEKSGMREAIPIANDITVQEDNLPRIEMVSPLPDLTETRNAMLNMVFDVTDDYGLDKVEVVYQVEEGPTKTAEAVLSNRITGPIDPTLENMQPRPKLVAARFGWKLAKMEDLPESGNLTYYIRARDNNPDPSRPMVRYPTADVYHVKLVNPVEFQFAALEQAKGILTEALLTWSNQLNAWEQAEQWKAKGTGEENDKIWAELMDAQERAALAARTMEVHMTVLRDKYERNSMQVDFMAAKLNVIADLLAELIDEQKGHMVKVEAGLKKARPRTSAAADPKVLKAMRMAALDAVDDDGWNAHDRQKMSVLIAQRIVMKVFDWRDLQTCTVDAKMMGQEQEDVLDVTQKIAPVYIGKEIYDLTDKQQEELITLGKRQKAVFDKETSLEVQIDFLMRRADKQNRTGIRDPLLAAFSLLRKERVNDNLKNASLLIANNQPSQIIDNQKEVIATLNKVVTGLLMAGQSVESDSPLDLKVALAKRENVNPEIDIDPTKPKPPSTTGQQTTTAPDNTGNGGEEPVAPPVGPEVLPEPVTTLAGAIRRTAEIEDSVRGRSVYLAANSDPKIEMPRFIRLKLLRLAEWQSDANAALADAQAKAVEKKKDADGKDLNEPQGSPAVQRLLAKIKDEFGESTQLIAAKDVMPVTQQLQSDNVRSLEDLLQYIALEQAVTDTAAENRRQNGVDAFDRKYLIRDSKEEKRQDLELAESVINRLNEAFLLQKDVLRKLHRFTEQAGASPTATAIDKADRGRSAGFQQSVAAILDEAVSKVNGMTPEVQGAIKGSGVGALLNLKAEFAGYVKELQAATPDADRAIILKLEGQRDDAGKVIQVGSLTVLGSAVQDLKDLLEARVKPPPAPVAGEAEQMSAEEWVRMTRPEALIGLIQADASLPEEMRTRMVEALKNADKFPQRYRELLTAYYASFVKQESKKPAPTTQPDKQEGQH